MDKPKEVIEAEAELKALLEKYAKLGYSIAIQPKYELNFMPIEGFVAPKVETEVVEPTPETPVVDAPTIDVELKQPE